MLLCLTTMINVVILLLLVLFGNGIYTQQESYYYYFISICSIKEVVDHVLNCHQIYPNAFNNHIDIILTWNRNHLLNTAKWSLFLVCHMMKLSLSVKKCFLSSNNGFLRFCQGKTQVPIKNYILYSTNRNMSAFSAAGTHH